jgi:heat shock protein HslJ
VATRMACLEPPGIMEQLFMAWLEDVRTYRLERGRLFLETGDGRGLVFDEVR